MSDACGANPKSDDAEAGSHKEGVSARPIASPLPVGMLALAVGSILLSGKQFGWLPVEQGQALALCLLGFVAPLQLLAFVFAVLARDGGFATGAAVFAGSWTATGLVTLTGEPGSRSPALGLLLAAAATALLVPIVTAAASKPLIMVIVIFSASRFATSAAFELSGAAVVGTVSAVIGLVLAAFGVYAAMAYALEDSSGRAVLPTFRRGDDGVPAEAGVRDEL